MNLGLFGGRKIPIYKPSSSKKKSEGDFESFLKSKPCEDCGVDSTFLPYR